jgi:hypothetical protein
VFFPTTLEGAILYKGGTLRFREAKSAQGHQEVGKEATLLPGVKDTVARHSGVEKLLRKAS